jgi:hypothetical protein
MSDENEDTSADKTGTSQNADDFTNIDVNSLTPENKEIYNSMLKDYRAKTEEIANTRKEFETKETDISDKYAKLEDNLKQWNDWYGNEVKPYWDDFEKFRTGDQVMEDQTINENDSLTEDNVISKLQSKVDALEGNFATKELEFRNYLNLNNQVWDLKTKHVNDPDFDVNKVIEYAVKKQMPDLYRAYDEVYKDRELDRYADEKVKQEREKWEEEQNNKTLATITGQNAPVSSFRYQPKKETRNETLTKVANEVAKKFPGF